MIDTVNKHRIPPNEKLTGDEAQPFLKIHFIFVYHVIYQNATLLQS
jgi:hypothetical protein